MSSNDTGESVRPDSTDAETIAGENLTAAQPALAPPHPPRPDEPSVAQSAVHLSGLGGTSPSRVVVESVDPEIDGGRFPAKRTVDEEFVVEADIFADGHDVIAAVVQYRAAGETAWSETPLRPLGNDRWRGAFCLQAAGWWEYSLLAWIDQFGTWRRDTEKKATAGQSVTSELQEGAELVREAARNATGHDADWLLNRARLLLDEDESAGLAAGLDPALAERITRYDARRGQFTYDRVLSVRCERERARFGAWYELFPRSCADEPRHHGTFADVEKRLPYVAEMGFDVLYLPPVHPIGRAFRKGANNALEAGPDDVGSPWAIGGAAGGHTSFHPELGTTDDFERLCASAKTFDLEIAIDIAFQCAPDHPYVREHPEWFRHRPDGTIKYAENPPKKYQDIYPLDFECDEWESLWNELLEVVLFWAKLGVRIFRVDNPHTKPFPFWEWLIAGVQEEYPDSIFLAEAFTRPRVMTYLAKCGFTQSYTYFTWRNSKKELIEYFTELNQTELRHYMRPNLFVNTPDILPEMLQLGGRPAFYIRFILAATLGSTYGIYGPVFETFENEPIEPGSEEYRDSEKYQIRQWPWDEPSPFRELIGLVNRIRRENSALQYNHLLRFHECDNPNIIFYSKTAPDLGDMVLVLVNVDPWRVESGWAQVPIGELGIGEEESYQVHDLITGAYYAWEGADNFVVLDPSEMPAHILKVRRRTRSERDFDYFA